MKKIVIKLAVALLRFFNVFFMAFSLKEKVTIISRQSNEPTLDIQMLADCLQENKIKTVVLTKKLEKGISEIISFSIHMVKQMYHIATSKVVVLDGYCILASVLPKRKGQKVVQIWHALGAIKKFGWQTVENPDGHSQDVAEIMCMHKNYDYILAPSKVTGSFFAEAFRTPEDKVVYLGLPRIDFIRKNDVDKNREIVQAYPVIKEKINILYAPTFRKNAELDMEKLVQGFDFSRFNLIIKKHFLDKGDYTWAENAGAIVDTKFSSLEWLRICEKVITDYSALAFEAAILDRELYIYQPDVNAYEHKVGLNIDLSEESISAYVCKNEEELFASLNRAYNKDDIVRFRKKHLEIDLDNCTKKLSDFIAKLLAE